MRSIPIPLLLLILVATLSLMTGCDKHHIDVYVNDELIFVNMDNGGEIETLWVFPGDVVSFTNISREKEFYLEFPAGMFEVDKTDLILPGHRLTLDVIATAPLEGEISIGPDSPIGNPKAKVGEDP